MANNGGDAEFFKEKYGDKDGIIRWDDTDYEAAIARIKRNYELAGLNWDDMMEFEESYNYKAHPAWNKELDYLWDIRD